jgi:4-diphosphocytidyl-2-C-methyl-D-erythritol kinase
MNTIRIRAHAKVNLTLEALQKRSDGYHDIETVFQAISLSDRLTFRAVETSGVELVSEDPKMPKDQSNLIVKAANAFFEASGINPFGIEVNVVKRIPMEAGLGGGSSDAAATLRALNMMVDKPVDLEKLEKIASTLGADVAYFLRGGTVFASGIGDDLKTLSDLTPMPLVIAKPDEGVSTAWAYEMLDKTPKSNSPGASRKLAEAINNISDLSDLAPLLFNDFESVVMAEKSAIQAVAEALTKAGAIRTLLCGSGSAVFGIFEVPHQARNTAAVLSKSGLWATYAFTAPALYTQTAGEELE